MTRAGFESAGCQRVAVGIEVQVDGLHGKLQPVRDQHPLDKRLVEVFEHDIHQPLANLGLRGIFEPGWFNLAEQLFGGFADLHTHLSQSLFAAMAFGRVDNRVQLEVIDLGHVRHRLEAETADLNGCALHAAESGDAAANVSDHGSVNRHHQQDEAGTPIATYELHEIGL